MPSLFPGRGPHGQVFVRGVENVALHLHPRQLGPQAADLHLFGRHASLAADFLQLAFPVRLHPVGQGLLHHSQAA